MIHTDNSVSQLTRPGLKNEPIKRLSMSEVVRLYRYKSLLSSRTAVSADDLMATLEVSRATLKRDIAKLRDQLHVPIRHDRDLGG